MKKLTGQQEKFSVLVANGMSYSDAFRVIRPHVKIWKDKSVNEAASKMFAKVLPRVTELREELKARELWTRENSVKALKGVIENPERNTDIVSAVKELNFMHGYHEPDVIDHKSSDGSMTPPRIELTKKQVVAEIIKAGFDPDKVALDE